MSSLTTLCQDHPFGGRSRLANLAAGREREWFQAYLQTLTVSLIRLYLDVGLTYEPHQQNTLLRLRDGLPEHALVRDSQGYFHREAAHEDICEVLPHHGEAAESIFPEALADERLVYYPFLNNALGVIDALGAGGGIDERTLLNDLRDTLARERKQGGRYPHTLLDRLLDDATWPCKANLRTRLHDMDELVGDISTQSVYVTIPNPLIPTIELVRADETPSPAARGVDERAARRAVVGRARRHRHVHGRAGPPRAVGGVRRRRPVRVRGDVLGGRGPARRSTTPRTPTTAASTSWSTSAPSARASRARWSASSWPATRAAPCASRTSATRGCSRSAAGSAARSRRSSSSRTSARRWWCGSDEALRRDRRGPRPVQPRPRGAAGHRRRRRRAVLRRQGQLRLAPGPDAARRGDPGPVPRGPRHARRPHEPLLVPELPARARAACTASTSASTSTCCGASSRPTAGGCPSS